MVIGYAKIVSLFIILGSIISASILLSVRFHKFNQRLKTSLVLTATSDNSVFLGVPEFFIPLALI